MLDPSEDNDDELSSDLRIGREFTIADYIAQEGGNFLKGESPVPRLLQAIAEINGFLNQHLSDSSGALQAVLQTWIKTDPRVGQHLDNPLDALQEILVTLIANQALLVEFVQQVDVKWGQMYDERPYFQQLGQAPHPEDEYTHDSVRSALLHLLNTLRPQDELPESSQK